MKKDRLFQSFYSKLSLIFLGLVFLLGTSTLIIAFNSAGHLFDEVEQLLNRDYAQSITHELAPLLLNGFDKNSVKEAIHYMMVLNPMVEIYLISEKGEILAYFTGPGDELVRENIDISPIKRFIKNDRTKAILGDDPRTVNKLKPFSAAPLSMGRVDGYVYVILRGQSFDRSLQMLRNSYYLQSGLITFSLALLATLIAGLSLFSLLTRPLRLLRSAVHNFETGHYDYQLDIKGHDELALVAKAFTDMTTTINDSINERRDLIANISHDLLSPLTSIRGHLETILLKEQSLSELEKREFLQISLNSVSSFQTLVEELFDLAKLESRAVKKEMEPFNLGELCQDVLLKLKHLAEESQIELFFDFDDSSSLFSGDIGLIERLLSNILENAILHSPQQGIVKLNLHFVDNCYRIIISDKGHGILPEDLPHIFERFYRADKSRDRRIEGTGLGLAIAKEIVLLHNGSIKVESEKEKGSQFIIELPLSDNYYYSI